MLNPFVSRAVSRSVDSERARCSQEAGAVPARGVRAGFTGSSGCGRQRARARLCRCARRPRTCAGSSLSVLPASLPPATRRQEWAPAGQKGPLPSRDSHLGQDTCTETDSRQARRVGNPLDRGPPPDPLYPKILRPPRGPGLPSISWRKEAGPGKGLEALRTCSAAHRVVTWPWALRAGWHLRSEVV